MTLKDHMNPAPKGKRTQSQTFVRKGERPYFQSLPICMC